MLATDTMNDTHRPQLQLRGSGAPHASTVSIVCTYVCQTQTRSDYRRQTSVPICGRLSWWCRSLPYLQYWTQPNEDDHAAATPT